MHTFIGKHADSKKNKKKDKIVEPRPISREQELEIYKLIDYHPTNPLPLHKKSSIHMNTTEAQTNEPPEPDTKVPLLVSETPTTTISTPTTTSRPKVKDILSDTGVQ